MPFYNDTLCRPEEMNSGRPSLKAKQSLPTSGTPNGLHWEHADVRLPPSANLNPMHQVWRPNPHHTGPGQRFQFPASSHPPHLLPSSIKPAGLSSEGKMRSRWQLIEKQHVALDKGVLWKWVFFWGLNFPKKKKKTKWSCRPNQTLSHTHSGWGWGTNPACARNSKMTKIL